MNGTWKGSGTWETSSGGGPVLLIAGAVILLGSGAAAAMAAAVVVVLIVAGVIIVLAAAGLTAYLIYRARRGHAVAVPAGRGIVPAPVVHQLGAPARPALEQPAARELHFHFRGTDPAQVAEILRSHQPDN